MHKKENSQTIMVNLVWHLLLVGVLSSFSVQAQVMITEVMYDVPGADYHEEFVELYNCSTDTIDLSHWQVGDSLESDELVETGQGLLLKPGQFAVVLDGSYFGHSTRYDSIIPPQALVLKIDDGAFGSNGFSNTISEKVLLKDANGDLVDFCHYPLGNTPGFSAEKIERCAENKSDNWVQSLVMWGTPGFKNSVEPADFDLAFLADGLRVFPLSAVHKGQTVKVLMKWKNNGVQAFSETVRFRCFVDLNGNQKLEVLEPVLYDQRLPVDLPPGATDSVTFTWQANLAGQVLLTAEIFSNLDQNLVNNTIQYVVTVIDSQATLVINEIKFLTQKGEPEWVELYNTTSQAVLLSHWGLADLKDTLWIQNNRWLAPHSYFVLAADSAIFDFYDLPDSVVSVQPALPALNNDQDVLFLLAPWGGWSEQVPYTSDWLMGEAYRTPSLERINPALDARRARNWAPCVKQGTPGQQNSVFAAVVPEQMKISASPNPFSPDGDGHEDVTVISLQVPSRTARVELTVFDMLGRKICTLAENHFSGTKLQMVWDGKDDHKKRTRMGIYIVFARMLDDANGLLQEAKTTVVVAY